jgi:hypothetical protein
MGKNTSSKQSTDKLEAEGESMSMIAGGTPRKGKGKPDRPTSAGKRLPVAPINAHSLVLCSNLTG